MALIGNYWRFVTTYGFNVEGCPSMRPIGCPEPSVTTNKRWATYKKNEGLIDTAVEARKHFVRHCKWNICYKNWRLSMSSYSGINPEIGYGRCSDSVTSQMIEEEWFDPGRGKWSVFLSLQTDCGARLALYSVNNYLYDIPPGAGGCKAKCHELDHWAFLVSRLRMTNEWKFSFTPPHNFTEWKREVYLQVYKRNIPFFWAVALRPNASHAPPPPHSWGF
jgi:hypothetical protein